MPSPSPSPPLPFQRLPPSSTEDTSHGRNCTLLAADIRVQLGFKNIKDSAPPIIFHLCRHQPPHSNFSVLIRVTVEHTLQSRSIRQPFAYFISRITTQTPQLQHLSFTTHSRQFGGSKPTPRESACQSFSPICTASKLVCGPPQCQHRIDMPTGLHSLWHSQAAFGRVNTVPHLRHPLTQRGTWSPQTSPFLPMLSLSTSNTLKQTNSAHLKSCTLWPHIRQPVQLWQCPDSSDIVKLPKFPPSSPFPQADTSHGLMCQPQ